MTAGTRDPTFGLFGMAAADFGGEGAGASAAAIQPDGKILVAGYATHAGARALAIARFHPNGFLDPTFGGGPGVAPGELRIALARGPSQALSMALQPDGKIVIGGQIDVGGGDTIMTVVRLLTDGRLDPAFGIHGCFLLETLRHCQANGLVVLHDGKIVAAGPSTVAGLLAFTLVGLRSDGTIDGAFGSGGVVRTSVGLPSSLLGPVPFAAVFQGFGIVAAGRSIFGIGASGILQPAIVRYHADGSVDSGFGDHGIVTMAARRAQCVAVAVSANFNILAAGNTSDAAVEFIFTILEARTGRLMLPHGPVVTTSFRDLGYGTAIAQACAVHNDRQTERWLLAGVVSEGSKRNIALARYQYDGSLDATFAGGRVITPFLTGPAEATAIAIQPADRKIVVAGKADYYGASIFALVRYLGL